MGRAPFLTRLFDETAYGSLMIKHFEIDYYAILWMGCGIKTVR